ncbi:MAG: peptidylprolyl isomerase [Ruminococcaceae bacterium]|nr:peptidylprolyl isomerase [Oscillospiraceae bacterium]
MEDLNFTALSSAEYDKLVLTPNDPSDLVSIKVSYTAADGESKSGNIVVRLFEEVAPQTVANFKKLVSSNHYAASEFHRVLKGFMIQGGDSVSGAGAKSIKGEFSENGFKNNLSHKRGVISMARGDEPNSASDEFFIVHQDTTELDGKYAAFGYVVYGMDIVDEIAALEVEANPKMDGEVSRPVDKVSITSVNFVNFR